MPHQQLPLNKKSSLTGRCGPTHEVARAQKLLPVFAWWELLKAGVPGKSRARDRNSENLCNSSAWVGDTLIFQRFSLLMGLGNIAQHFEIQ